MYCNRNYLLLFLVVFFQTISAFGQFAPEKIKGGLFIENKGQWDANVLYRSEIPSGQLYIEKNRFLFNFYDAEAMAFYHHGSKGTTLGTSEERVASTAPKPTFIKAHSYEVSFIGCSPISSASGTGPASYSHNYFKGKDKSKWASNAGVYSGTVLNNIYPNTSLVCLGQETGFKYEFHLAAGANPALIKLRYEGVDSVYLKNGELFVETSVTDFYEQMPVAYQEINGANVAVPCEFRLDNNLLTFAFPKGYNKRYPLIIDPQLIFSTYSGSTADNWGNSATYDDDGNTYMVGIAFDQGYPVTTGAYQIQYNGFQESVDLGGGQFYPKFDPDIAIMKFDPVGKLLYATYLGGTETEVPSSCIVNSKKELTILGFTSSDGGLASNGLPGLPFPTTAGAYDVTFNGGAPVAPMSIYDGIFFDKGSDLFLATLSEFGNTLNHSTLLGGSANDGITYIGANLTQNYGDQFRGEIYCDELDQFYVVTKTFSSDIINTSVPGYDQTFNGQTDAYVCKFSADLTTMIWNTYIGGSRDDAGYSIRVASDKSVYIAGGTTSNNFPGTTGLIQTYSGNIDGFITHISSDGTTLLHGTYIGTPAYDQCFFIQLDAAENIYVLGQTTGDYLMSPGVYGQPSAGQFIQKIDPTLSTALLSTTLGNVANTISIVPTAFLVNSCDNILISGWGGNVNQYLGAYIGGNTFNLPTTANAAYKVTDGSDFYLMVLEKEFKSLLYATYYGGYGEDDHVDGGTSRFDKKGIAYQSVCASCNTTGISTSLFPTTPGAFATKKGSDNCNNACFKFDLSNLRADFTTNLLTTCDSSAIVTLTNTSTGGSAFQWDLGDGTTSTDFGPIHHVYNKPGKYIIKLIATDLTTCIGRDTAVKTITIYPRPLIDIASNNVIICLGDTISSLVTCNPTYQYSWSPNVRLSNPAICNPSFYPLADQKYFVSVTDTNGCVAIDSILINVTQLTKGISWENMTHCDGKPTIKFSNPSTGPLNYLWTFGDGHSSTEASPVHQYSKGDTYFIVVDIHNDYCALQDKITIKLEDIIIPNLFTPNGDTKNDCFEIQGLYENWNVEIYNAWSKRIFKSDSYKNDFCGDNVSSSVYYYLVCAPYGDCCKSWVQIIKD